MAMAIAKAKEVGADLILASDPDADRIGCVLRDDNGEYVLINGNQIVMILLNYIMTRNKEMGKITGNEYIVKTIVTTETIKSIADKNGFKMYDCYTGFKWIAAVIRENEGVGRYLGGGEESYGFLAEDELPPDASGYLYQVRLFSRSRYLVGTQRQVRSRGDYRHHEGIPRQSA